MTMDKSCLDLILDKTFKFKGEKVDGWRQSKES